jgi:hypothetical protein
LRVRRERRMIRPLRCRLAQETRGPAETADMTRRVVQRSAMWGRIAVRRSLGAATAAALSVLLSCNSFSLNLLSHDKNEKMGVDTRVLPAPPGRYSFRIAPYVFLSDFEVKRDQPLFQELAKLRDQVYRELQLTPSRSAVQVYLFEDKDRYDQFMNAVYPNLPPRRAFFIAQQRAMGGTDDLLVYTRWGDRIQQDLRHELTHALLHSVIRDVPLWLDEGLAEYFELPPQSQGVNASHVETLRRDLGVSFQPELDRLEKMKDVNDMKGPEYREAWMWTHLMLHSGPEAKAVLLEYLQDLRTNRNTGLLGARLTAVFPSPEKAFKKHLNQIELPVNARLTPSPPLSSIPR